MSILSDFEDSMARAIEGAFAGVFRSPVQPVEIAKSLARAMDDGRIVGVGRIYAPVTYRVALSEADSDKLEGFLKVLGGELSTYLVDHAREMGYHLVEKPRVEFSTRSQLRMGRFRVGADLAPAQQPAVPGPAPAPAASARTPSESPAQRGLATVTVGDTHHDVTLVGQRIVAGRLADCDIRIEDANASRRHAAFVADGDGWRLEDLGSTNGTKVNGHRVQSVPLSDGDVVTIGITRLTFHQPSR